jgi:hypothetical protein
MASKDGRFCFGNFMFTSGFQDWELELVDFLIDPLYSYLPREEGLERLIWKLSALENLMFPLLMKF